MPFAFYNVWFWISALFLTIWCMWPLLVADRTESRTEVVVGANGGFRTAPQSYYTLGGAVVALASCIGAVWVSIYVFQHLHPLHGKFTGYEIFFLITWGIIALEAMVALTQVERPVRGYSSWAAIMAVWVNALVTVLLMAFYPGAMPLG